MSIHTLSSDFANYNQWANQTLIAFLGTKPTELMGKEIPSSYASILKTLNHIWSVEAYWYAQIAEVNEFEQRWEVQNLVAEEIFEGLLNRSRILAEKIASYTEAELLKPIKVESPWFNSTQPRYKYLLHLVNHSTYHRGQLVTIGRNLGFTDAPMTDYNFYNVMMENKAQQSI